LGELTVLPRPLAGLRGPHSKTMGRRREKEGKGKRREGQGTKGPPPFANSWIRPWRVLTHDVPLKQNRNHHK